MNKIDAVNLHNELNHLKSVNDLCLDFHRHIESADGFPDLPGDVTVKEGVIHVRILGHDITAVPRPVKVSSSYAIEYSFCALCDGIFVPLFQFYLQEGGKLTQSPNIGSPAMCDFNNKYIKKVILTSITSALLNSVVFKPHAISNAG